MAKVPFELKKQIAELMKQGIKPVDLSKIYGIPQRTMYNYPNEVAKIEAREAVIKKHLGAKMVPVQPSTGGEVVLAIPDMHHPFCHPDALAFLKAVRDKYQPTKFVCLGDEIDAHAFSKYPKDPDGLAPGLEITQAREALIPFYREFPEMLVCESNHTVRPWKQAFSAGLPASFLPTYSTFLNAPDGWKWAHSHEIDGVRYIHGEGRSGFSAHIHFMRGYKQSVVIGHIHSYAAVSYEGSLFAVNSGCLIDANAYCFRYAKHMPIPVNLGCSIIHHGKRAEFIPMHTENGRWTGSL